jgi:ribosome maturation factor RimP
MTAALASPVIEALGLELWDAEFIKEAGSYYLRVYIDAPAGSDRAISIDDCEAVSRAMNPLLDEREASFPDEGYIFEVSSAGAERALRRPSDFVRFTGSLVEVKLYGSKNGKHEYVGILSAYSDGDVTLDVDGETMQLLKNEIANVRLRLPG